MNQRACRATRLTFFVAIGISVCVGLPYLFIAFGSLVALWLFLALYAAVVWCMFYFVDD